jgi:predicted phosphodiesterase
MKVLTITDVHNRSPVSHWRDAVRLIAAASYDVLVLGGDTHDTNGTPEPCFLDQIARVARNREVWVLDGNHDPQSAFWARNVGCRVASLYLGEDGGRRFVVTHGHCDPITRAPWDSYLYGSKYHLTAFANWCETGVAFCGDWGQRLAIGAHHLRKYLCDVKSQVREAALAFGQHHGLDTVLCGHSHLPEFYGFLGRVPRYVNVGSWAEPRMTYGLTENGMTQLIDYR